MVFLAFQFMARTQNVGSIQMPQESDWHVTLACGHCRQQFPKQVTFNKSQTVDMIKQHGVAHFNASCKNCDRKCFIILDQNSPYVVKPNEDGIIKALIARVQCRGCEITKVNLGNSMTVKAANSQSQFQNADFTYVNIINPSDLWCEMDEQTGQLCQVEDPRIQIVQTK